VLAVLGAVDPGVVPIDGVVEGDGTLVDPGGFAGAEAPPETKAATGGPGNV